MTGLSQDEGGGGGTQTLRAAPPRSTSSSAQLDDLLPGDMRSFTQPSVTSVQLTFAAMQRTVQVITEDCSTVTETLDNLGSALEMVSAGNGSGHDLGSFGMLSLPILGAIKAVRSVAGQYVKQHTGVPLSTWTDLVTDSQTQFADYLTELSTVAVLAGRHQTAPIGTALDGEQLVEDELALRRLQWQTQVWKKILGRIAQLGSVVDAILQADVFADAPDPGLGDRPDQPADRSIELSDKASERASRFGQTFRKQIRDVQNRTVDRSGDLRELVLRPFLDVRERVRHLPAQAQALAHAVALLELLLDLEVAQLRAFAGKASAREAQVVGMRVAVNVLLPELVSSINQERRTLTELDSYLGRLEDARARGAVAEHPFAILSDEYRDAARRSQSRLEQLDEQVETWRRAGMEMLRTCVDITDLELAVVKARRLAGEPETDSEHRAVLLRERERLDEAATLLAAL